MLLLEHDLGSGLRQSVPADLIVEDLQEGGDLLGDAHQSPDFRDEALLELPLLRVLRQADLHRSDAVEVPAAEAVDKGQESLLLWWFFDGG